MTLKSPSMEAAIAFEHYALLDPPRSFNELRDRLKEAFPQGVKIPALATLYRWKDEYNWEANVNSISRAEVDKRLTYYREQARAFNLDIDVLSVTRHFENNSEIANITGEIILDVLPIMREKMITAARRLVIPDQVSAKDLSAIIGSFKGLVETARKAQEMGLEEEGLQRVLEEMEVI